jgi:hypothetical protein
MAAQYLEIDPKDIGNIQVTVELVGESAEEMARDQESDDRRLANQTLDRKTYMERRGDRDPGMLQQRLDDQFVHDNVILPALAQAAQTGVTAIVAQAATDAGYQFTPEELAAALLLAQQQGVPSAGQSPPTAGGTTPAANAGGGPVGTQGAALSGTAYQNGESSASDNPQIARPNSVDAMAQRQRLNARAMMQPK